MPTADALALDTAIVRSQDQLTGDIDQEIVLLSLDKGEYYQLNEAGRRVWELLETPWTVSALIDRLLEEFEVDRAACEPQVLAFLRTMYAEGLIEVAARDAPL